MTYQVRDIQTKEPAKESRQPNLEPKDLQSKINNINGWGRASCLSAWQDAFGRSPPKHLSVQFLKRVLIWELQSRVLGGVPIKTERRLKQIASVQRSKPIVRSGAHLVREWNGRGYQVEVVEGGYVMDGKTWTSLSAIAKHITGAHWSGPRFFGVQS